MDHFLFAIYVYTLVAAMAMRSYIYIEYISSSPMCLSNVICEKKNVYRSVRFKILGTQNANEIQVHEQVGNSFLVSYKVHIIKL